MFYCSLAFLAGVIFIQQLARLPSAGWLLLLIPAIAAAFRFPRLLALLFLVSGAGWAGFSGAQLLEQHVPSVLEKKTVTVEGEILSLPIHRRNKLRFDFRITSAMHQGQQIQLPENVRLSVYFRKGQSAWRPSVGDKWRLGVRLKNPHGFQNPGGFDYESYLFSNRIRATGYVVNKSEKVFLGSGGWQYALDRTRAAISEKVKSTLKDSSQAGIITALANGDRQGLKKEEWGVLTRTGTIHLVAISGLHLSLVSGLIFFLVKFGWGYIEYGAKRYPAQKAAALIALLAAGFYAGLAGFSIPTQRALIMLAVIYLAIMFARQPLRIQSLAAAIFLVLVFDPLSVLSPGFWLSFTAVVIIYFTVVGRNSKNGWRDGLRMQWSISIGIIPVTILFFQNASLVSPIANIIAIPVYAFLVVPLTLTGLTLSAFFPEFIGSFLLLSAGFISELGWSWLKFLDGFSAVNAQIGSPGIVATACVLIGLAIIALPSGFPSRWIGVLWCAPLLWIPARPEPGEFQATLLDVGQGLSLVLQTQNHALVYDAGARYSQRFDAGEAVVVPYLRHIGVSSIDAMIVSHGDNDHVGGLSSIQKNFPIDSLITNTSNRNSCISGKSWKWDGVKFKILHPEPNEKDDGNNSSCVLLVTSPWGKLLATGDIEKKAEKKLLDRFGNYLQSNVLISPHHGSRTSSSLDFLNAINPKWILIPAGHLNRYRHPAKAVIKRYDSMAANWLVSGNQGAITMQFSSSSNSPNSYRSSHRRYWHNPKLGILRDSMKIK